MNKSFGAFNNIRYPSPKLTENRALADRKPVPSRYVADLINSFKLHFIIDLFSFLFKPYFVPCLT